eukprot:gene6507-3145_t
MEGDEVTPSESALRSFLTESQRAALDEALAEKAAEHAVAARAAGHQKALVESDRKSRMGKGTGAAKKGGGGGRFTWGSIMTNADDVEVALDRSDPNYDSEEERTTVMLRQQRSLKEEVNWYKQQVAGIVEEYFGSGDIAEVAESLDELGMLDLMHYFVKRLITLSLDRKDREREMTSVLLSSLYAEVIPPEQVQKGFLSLVNSLEDLVLDVPGAPDLLATFISRAVVDDVLPPAMANRIPEAPAALLLLKQKVEANLLTRHSAEKILRCWSSDTKESIQKLLTEYGASLDLDEAARCLRNLSVPFFHHELVKQAIHLAMSSPSSSASGSREAMVGLLTCLMASGELRSVQLLKGVKRVTATLDDLCLDNPTAKVDFQEVTKLMMSADLLSSSDLASCSSEDTSAPATNGTHSLSAFKSASIAAVREYFDSSDVDEVARR